MLKTWQFWVSLVMTLLGLCASNGLLGSGTGMTVAGWVATIGSLLGVHMLNAPALPAGPTPPAAS